MALTDIAAQRLGDSIGDKLGDRNLIINGAMNVAQRGTSSTSTGIATVDRWHSGGSGGTITQTQESTTSSDSPYAEGFRKYFRQTNTAVASASSHFRQIETKLEAQDIANSGWNYTNTSSFVTVSAWLRSSKAGTYSYQLRTVDGTAQSYTATVTLVADTWKKITQSFPGNSNLTFDNNNGLGIRVVWFPYLGADYTTSSPTLNAWHAFSGSNISSDDTAGWGTTTNATFDITGVQLELGNTATEFAHERYGVEFLKCERYFESINGRSECFAGYSYSTTAAQGVIRYRTVKRDTPGTITLAAAGQSEGQLTFLTAGGSYPSATGTNAAQLITPEQFRILGSSYTGLTDDSSSFLYITASASATIASVDAEL